MIEAEDLLQACLHYRTFVLHLHQVWLNLSDHSKLETIQRNGFAVLDCHV